MMTQTEINALIQKVESGQYRIDAALNDIAMAAKGESVRSAIYAALLNTYMDGKAGSGGDAVARAMITNLRNDTPTNQDYADMAFQMAQLREMAHIIDTGNTGVVDVEPSSYTDVQVTFSKTFNKKPRVFATVAGNSTSTNYGLLSVAVPQASITTSGCVVRIYNTHTNLFQPSVSWIAVGEVEIATAYSMDNSTSGTGVTAEMAYSLWAILQKCAFSSPLTATEKNAFKNAWGIDDGGYTPPDNPTNPDDDNPTQPDTPVEPDEPSGGGANLVYSLPSAETFNADHVIDTGYALMDRDKDWMILIDATDSARGGTVLDTSHNGSGSVKIGNRGGYYRTVYLQALYFDVGNDITNRKIALWHAEGSETMQYKWQESGGEVHADTFVSTSGWAGNANIIGSNAEQRAYTVKLGGQWNGTAADYKGTVNRCEIYEGIDTSIIDAFV